jgi:hypothetical protein
MRRVLISVCAVAILAGCGDSVGPSASRDDERSEVGVAGVSLMPGFDSCLDALHEMAAVRAEVIEDAAAMEGLSIKTLGDCGG